MQHVERYHAPLTHPWCTGGVDDEREDGGSAANEAAGSERLQRYLARAGVASRRKAEALIEAGRVRIDGDVAALGAKVGPGQRVTLDGAEVRPLVGHRTFALHKPAGVVSTASDERGRRTVLDLLPAVPGLHPVGRLDLDSEGLLLLTTDGDLTMRLTHPRFGHAKTYRAWCAGGTLPEAACRSLETGVRLEDGPARALQARPAPGGAVVVLGDGRKRQLRRMLEAVGQPVERLLRTHIGELALGDLAPGAHVELGEADLRRLGYTPPTEAGPSSTAKRPSPNGPPTGAPSGTPGGTPRGTPRRREER
jgi:23S rRNA pseudouridine2605 synthase